MNCLRSLEHCDRGFPLDTWMSAFILGLCKVAALRRADHSPKESYREKKKDYKTEGEARAQQRAVEPVMNG
jgi:hypothetical protein